MLSRVTCVILLCLPTTLNLPAADSWPQFRGPHGDGIANEQAIPTEFSDSKGVTWRTELPGLAWSSPVVADDIIWVTTAIERIPSEDEKLELLKKNGIEERKFKQLSIAKSIELKLIAINLKNGSIQQTINLTQIDSPDPIHSLNSYASPTPVIDSDHIYCHFGTYGTFCIHRKSGELVWQRKLPLVHSVGPGSSPFLLKQMLVLIQDGVGATVRDRLGQALPGKTLWEVDRPEMDAPTGAPKRRTAHPSQSKTNLDESTDLHGISMDGLVRNGHWQRTLEGLPRKGFSVVPAPCMPEGRILFNRFR